MPSGYTFDSNHGPGVGMSSSGSRSSGSGGSSNSGSSGGSWSNVKSSINSLVKSVSNAASTNASAAGQAIRDTLANPSTSARQAMLYDSYIDDYGLAFDMDEYLDQLMSLNQKNNEWSAAQAQKQMNFQKSQADAAMAFENAQAEKMMGFQRRSDEAAMAWSASEAQKSRDWTENLSNTAHQREIKDLLAAGLNPILSANQGAWSGSGATGQGFSSSGAMASGYSGNGAMGDTDMSAGAVLGQMMSGMMTTARDLAITKLQTNAQRYSSDRAYAASKLATEASIFNNNSSISAQKAINALNRDTDIQKASISADATRAAAGANAGAIMSAAATNAAAAKYSADQHLEASKYGSDQSLSGTKYSSDKSYESTQYNVDHNVKSNPVGYIAKTADDLAKAWSNVDNVYSPGLDQNLLGSE